MRNQRQFLAAVYLCTIVFFLFCVPSRVLSQAVVAESGAAEKIVHSIDAILHGKLPTRVQFEVNPVELQDPEFLYQGFAPYDITILADTPIKKVQGKHIFSVLLRYKDNMGRLASVGCNAQYRLERDAVIVEEAVTYPVYEHVSEVVMYIAPARRVPANFMKRYPTHDALLQFVRKNSLSIAKLSDKRDDYYLFLFVLKRMEPDAELIFAVSRDRRGLRGNTAKSLILNYANFRVGVMRGSFAFNRKPALFFKLIYAPGNPLGERFPRRLLAQFPSITPKARKGAQDGCLTLAQVYTDGSGDSRTKKLGGNYAAIKLDSLRDDQTLRVETVSGRLAYVTLHARYKGGYWRTIYKGPKTEFPVGQYLASYKKDKNCTHVNVSVNGAHEKYDPVACKANLLVCSAPDILTPPQIPAQDGCSTLAQVYTDGSGDSRTKKLGGNYAAIKLDSLRDDQTLRVETVSGRLAYVTLHARYKGGYWRTIYKGPKTEFPVGQYLASYKKDSNCTHVNVSVNGAHEKYDPVACKANLLVCSAPDKPAHVLTPPEFPKGDRGLVAYYPFDGNFRDYSGSGNNGSPKGEARFVNGIINSAVELDGRTVITAPQPAGGFNFSDTNAITMSTWVYISSEHSGFNGVIAVGNYCDYRMMISPGLSPFWDMGRHADHEYGEFKFKNDRWYHYVIVGKKEGNNLRTYVYINGDLRTTVNEPFAKRLPNGNITYIGTGENGGAYHFKGKIDEVRIYNRAISQAEVRALYNQGSDGITGLPSSGTVTTGELSNIQKKLFLLRHLNTEAYQDYQNLHKQYAPSVGGGGYSADHPVALALNKFKRFLRLYEQVRGDSDVSEVISEGKVITAKMRKDVLSQLVNEAYQHYLDSLRTRGIDDPLTRGAFDQYRWLFSID